MVFWCLCTDDQSPHKVFGQDEVVEPLPDMHETSWLGESNPFSYTDEEYATQNASTAWSETRWFNVGDGNINDATERMVTKTQTRRIENPQSMTEDNPLEAARIFTSLSDLLKPLSCVRGRRSDSDLHLGCCQRAHIRKDRKLPDELLNVGSWVTAQAVDVNVADKKGSASSLHKIKEGFEAGVEYTVGEIVEYYSQSLLSWIPAQVLGSYGNGKYRLDCKTYASPEHIRRPKATFQAMSCPSSDGGVVVGRESADQDFCVGDVVEYNSKTQGGWIAAKVLSKNRDGTYKLDVKPDAVPSKMRRQSTAPAGLFQTIVPEYLLEPIDVQPHEERDADSCDPQLICPSRAANRFRLLCSSTPALVCTPLAPISLTGKHADYDPDGYCHASEPMLSSMLC
jgi:hypothetical protein